MPVFAACTENCTALGHVTYSDLSSGTGIVTLTSLTDAGDADFLLRSAPQDVALTLRALGSGLASVESEGRSIAILAAGASPGANSIRVLAQWRFGVLLSHSVVADHQGGRIAVISSNTSKRTVLNVLDVVTGNIVHTESFDSHSIDEFSCQTGAVFLGTFVLKDGQRGFRALVVRADASVSLLQEELVVWTREEGLASVVNTLIVELAAVAIPAALHTRHASIWTRFVGLLKDMPLGPKTISQSVRLVPVLPLSPEVEVFPRDEHGFNRMLVMLTSSGKVFGMRSSDGTVVWTWLPRSTEPLPRLLLLWRGGRAPLVLLVGTSSSHTHMVWLDACTGDVRGTETVPINATHVVPLDLPDLQGELAMLLWDATTREVVVFSESYLTRSADCTSSVYLHSIDAESGTVSGFALAQLLAMPLRAVPIWSVALNASILAYTSRVQTDPVFSLTRVLGDRSSVRKFISLNTLLVANHLPANPQGTDDGVQVSLIDTVTGRILYRVRHTDATGPVVMTAAENMFVYSYWSVLNHRTEVSVLELFDDSLRPIGLAASVLRSLAAGRAAIDRPSSLSPPVLRVIGQSYGLTASLAALSTTVTRHGLATRHVLVTTQSGRIVALDRRFLDPRRPVKATAADREEGLIPYSEVLPLLPGAFLSGASRIARVRSVLSAPAGLESASHVLAIGFDIFYTRTAPSRTFDTLGDDFSRPLLAVTVVVLGIGAMTAGWIVRRDDLTRQWA